MPTREQIAAFVRLFLGQWVHTPDDIWVALYRLLLDYAHGVPRITDANRLVAGIWRRRAEQVEQALAAAMQREPKEVVDAIDALMLELYGPGLQRMNPVGIAFASAIVHLIERAAPGKYSFKIEAKIGKDIFPNLTDFRRKSVDIVVFQQGEPYAIISSKWGIRHDRVRDPQEEADTYKQEIPTLKFFVATNEFDNARLQKVLTYPTIDGVFHVRRDLVWQVYGSKTAAGLASLKDITELLAFFTTGPTTPPDAQVELKEDTGPAQLGFDL